MRLRRSNTFLIARPHYARYQTQERQKGLSLSLPDREGQSLAVRSPDGHCTYIAAAGLNCPPDPPSVRVRPSVRRTTRRARLRAVGRVSGVASVGGGEEEWAAQIVRCSISFSRSCDGRASGAARSSLSSLHVSARERERDADGM